MERRILSIDITLGNKDLMNYLEGSSNLLPVEAFKKVLLVKPSEQSTFTDTLLAELKKGIETAISLGVSPNSDLISNRMLDITSALVELRGDPTSDKPLHQAALAFRHLWQHAKKLNSLGRGGR